jgi:hypothetical protein
VGGGGTYGQHFSILNIMQIVNLELKLYIVLKSWTEKLNFSAVANILKMSASIVFFANLILCP